MCKKCAIIAVSVYAAGVAYELYSIPSTDTAKNQKAFGWPYYLITGFFGVIQGTHSASMPFGGGGGQTDGLDSGTGS